MSMNKKDEEIILNFCKERHLKKSSTNAYLTAAKMYCKINNETFENLIHEAEIEEQNNIPWKTSKLKKRLLNFRNVLMEQYLSNTVRGYTSRIYTLYYEGFDIEIGKLPKINTRNVLKPRPISFQDLPDEKLLKQVVGMVNPLMKAIILFMSSSGCARRETINISIRDFIDATKEYHNQTDIYKVMNILKNREDVVPSWHLKRQKTNKYYSTFSSPESTTAILQYLFSEERELTMDSKLFDISPQYLITNFEIINNQLGLGKAGSYNRFRSHMLRKFHASQLYNDGLSMDEIDELQGRGKDQTRTSYFLEDPNRLREKYIEHMNAVTINLDVNNLDIKSPEYIKLETENIEKEKQIQKYEEEKKKQDETMNWFIENKDLLESMLNK